MFLPRHVVVLSPGNNSTGFCVRIASAPNILTSDFADTREVASRSRRNDGESDSGSIKRLKKKNEI